MLNTGKQLIWVPQLATTYLGLWAKRVWTCDILLPVSHYILQLQVVQLATPREAFPEKAATAWEGHAYRLTGETGRMCLFYYCPMFLANETPFERVQSRLLEWYDKTSAAKEISLYPFIGEPPPHPDEPAVEQTEDAANWEYYGC